MTEPKLGRLLGAVLHDLHGPLNAAQLHFTRFMLQPKPPEGRLDDVSSDALNSALRALRRMERLSRDGTRLAALLAGEAVPLARACCSLLEQMRALHIEEPTLVERLNWDAFPPDMRIHADPLCLYRVLANLLSNARRHGGPQVRVAAQVVDTKSTVGLPVCPVSLQYARAALVSVSDDGAGIAAESRAHLFQPFWRPPAPRAQQGNGLGLWLSRQLVRAHGGELWLSSENESQFCTLWPLHGERPRVRAPRPVAHSERLRQFPARTLEIPPHTPLAGVERMVILETLRQCNGHKQIAALLLGISRRALYDKLRRYGV